MNITPDTMPKGTKIWISDEFVQHQKGKYHGYIHSKWYVVINGNIKIITKDAVALLKDNHHVSIGYNEKKQTMKQGFIVGAYSNFSLIQELGRKVHNDPYAFNSIPLGYLD